MGKRHNKNKDKDRYTGPSKTGRDDSDSDESEGSAVTYDEDLQSIMGGVEDLDDVYDKLVENLDRAQEKNARVRIEGLHGLILALTAKAVPEFISRNKATLMSLCSRFDNKQDTEARMIAMLIGLVTVQGGMEVSEDVQEPMAQLRTILMDASRDVDLRIACALSLSIITRLACDEDEEVSANLKACRFAWANTKATSGSAKLIEAALTAWCINLIDVDLQGLNSAIADQPKVVTLLASDQVDVRIAAAETLAFLHEFMEDARPGFRFPNKAYVLELLDDMVSDFTKKKTKRDKRVQRYAIRDIRAFIADEDETPSVSVKIGRETLSLDSCAVKMFYDVMCDVLRGGLGTHLQNNEVLRDIFQLGAVPLMTEEINKKSRLAAFDTADKMRKQIRSKQRDKRTAMY